MDLFFCDEDIAAAEEYVRKENERDDASQISVWCSRPARVGRFRNDRAAQAEGTRLQDGGTRGIRENRAHRERADGM